MLLICFAGGLAFYYISGLKDANRNWNRTLKIDDKEPYDLSVFYETLRETLGDKYHESKPQSEPGADMGKLAQSDSLFNYFYIGRRIFLNDKQTDLMMAHVEKGAVAFIAANSLPEDFIRRFPSMDDLVQEVHYNDTVFINFLHPKLSEGQYHFTDRYKDRTREGEWNYFNSTNTSQADSTGNAVPNQFVVITAIDSFYADCIYTRYGAGGIYIHLNPVLFSNLYMQTPDGIHYLQGMMKHLPVRHTLFDRSLAVARPDSRSGRTSKTVFSFIQQNRSLEYAWWMLISGLGLFLLTGGKRKQKSIPVIAQPANNALQMIGALGQFYYTENENVLVFKREWSQFLNFIRMNIRVNAEDGSEAVKLRIAEKSGVDIQIVNKAFDLHNKYIIFSELNNEELMETNRSLTQFYTEYFKKHGKH